MKEKIQQMDYLLLITVLLLSAFGLVMVYSASYPIGYEVYHNSTHFFVRQFLWVLIGFLFLIVTVLIPLHRINRMVPLLVISSIFFLVLVLIPGIGIERNYAQRWISIGRFVFQPTEAIKVSMVIYFAYIYARKQSYIHKFGKGVLPPLLLLATVFMLILLQPDLGTASLILFSCGIIVFCSRVRFIHLVALGTIAILGVSYFAYTSPYRLQRLTSFQQPFETAATDGYQLINSYIAIAAGGITGNGLGNSVQKLGYLPEAHTDFIMAIIVEELGIVGLIIVLAAYLMIFYRGIHIAFQQRHMFPKLLALGLTFQIIIQAILNLGAVSGMLPVTGITLPFISYGGSSLLFMLISVGILINISTLKYETVNTR
ncbi:MAG: putative lipid II flippase FtsW [Bacillota bacterium]|uniref:putative lipid II flippase FtsW n=1 Tax=unclassified Virgibacillus TaxID=2620237 RepID=UPI000EF4D9F2|nr:MULTISPECIES: putative lipid II flippase FtsW [unclassified Virgibacillus]MCC2248504.1 putative lipid II flippase FtsW [Virgibacillus sp. AGTR]MDY7043061.1 putative lipid II flippase FtsW [Virgibacillus sp. M23]QRZ16633.1 putative lipid II flippase FtsW [Virgibacillus sp. AGTR]